MLQVLQWDGCRKETDYYEKSYGSRRNSDFRDTQVDIKDNSWSFEAGLRTCQNNSSSIRNGGKGISCGMLAGIVLSTTKVSEFLSAMNRIHAPKKFVITFAVMLRYIPTIQEDWHFVKDAMRMRDVSPSLGGFLSHPGMTVECIYVPLMMMASKAADELSIASVTRGIENPNPRTCLVQIKCGIADWMAMLIAVAFFIFELCMRGGVTG